MTIAWRKRLTGGFLITDGAPSFKLDKLQAPGYNGRQKEKVNMKQELKKINDELMEFYNKPSMALHFQPTNLRVLRRLIKKLVLLEKSL